MLDNTIVLYGSGASTTHLPENLPTLVAGGANMGLKHGQYWRNGKTQMSDVFLSILHSLGVEEETFADSTQGRPFRARELVFSSPIMLLAVSRHFKITTSLLMRRSAHFHWPRRG